MQAHINQALHNEQLVNDLCNNYPDNYFDWKVTATFYTALHLLRAFCVMRKVNPGSTHQEIANNFDPRRCKKQITPCPKYVWENYSKLQRYSEHSRYEVYLDPDVENEIQRDNFTHCQELISSLKDYFQKQGVPCVIERAA